MITTAEFGGVASAQLIDVSNFQGNYDWAAAKAQVPQLAGGICKLTEGTGFTDSFGQHNWSGIAGQGLVRGGYHFAHPGSSASAQVDHFLSTAIGLGLASRDILALDLEVSDGLGPAQVASWAQEFMSRLVADRPHNPLVVYTFVNFATGGYCNGLGKYPLWLAFPNNTAPVPPPPWAAWTFWQWGSRSGVDADAFNGTADQLTAWVDSFQPAPAPSSAGPYRHELDGRTTLAQLAAQRNTTPYRLLRTAVENYTDGDVAHLAGQTLPAGTRYYTVNP